MSSGGGESQLPPPSPSADAGARTHGDVNVDGGQQTVPPATLFSRRVKWSCSSIATGLSEATAVRSIEFENLDTSQVKGDDDDERLDELDTYREFCARVEQGASETGLQDNLLFLNDVLKDQVDKATEAFIAESVQLVEACDDPREAPLWGAVFNGGEAAEEEEQPQVREVEEGDSAAAAASKTTPSSEGSAAAEAELEQQKEAGSPSASTSSRAWYKKHHNLDLHDTATVANVRNMTTAAADEEIRTSHM